MNVNGDRQLSDLLHPVNAFPASSDYWPPLHPRSTDIPAPWATPPSSIPHTLSFAHTPPSILYPDHTSRRNRYNPHVPGQHNYRSQPDGHWLETTIAADPVFGYHEIDVLFEGYGDSFDEDDFDIPSEGVGGETSELEESESESEDDEDDDDDDDTSQSSSPSLPLAQPDTEFVFDFNDFLEDDGHTPPPRQPSYSATNPIDLTRSPSHSPSPTMPLLASATLQDRTRKRSAAPASSSDAGQTSKRRRADDGSTSQSANSNPNAPSASTATAKPPIEILDLCASDDEADGAKSALATQRAEQSAGKKAAKERKSKLTTLTCSICIEPPTDLVGTVCGHTFCRACLLDWLVSSERELGKKATCPACRKALNRTETAKRKDVVPLVFMRGEGVVRVV